MPALKRRSISAFVSRGGGPPVFCRASSSRCSCSFDQDQLLAKWWMPACMRASHAGQEGHLLHCNANVLLCSTRVVERCAHFPASGPCAWCLELRGYAWMRLRGCPVAAQHAAHNLLKVGDANSSSKHNVSDTVVVPGYARQKPRADRVQHEPGAIRQVFSGRRRDLPAPICSGKGAERPGAGSLGS